MDKNLPTADASVPQPIPTGWVRGPVWDSVWLLTPLWWGPLLLTLSIVSSSVDDGVAGLFVMSLTCLFWIGHRLSSLWVAWFSSAYRPLRQLQPTRFLWMPFVIAMGSLSLIIDPWGLLPGNAHDRVLLCLAVDFFFLSWHFSAQHFGILRLYATHGRRQRALSARRRDRCFAFGVAGIGVMLAEVLRGTTTIPEPWSTYVGVRGVDDDVILMLRALGFITMASATVVFVVWEARAVERSRPRVLYLATVGSTASSAFVLDPAWFIPLWTIPHWLAATGLASVVVRNEPTPTHPGALSRGLHKLHQHPLGFVALIGLLSVVFFPVFDVEAGNVDTTTMPNISLYGIVSVSADAVTYLVALGFTSGLLHYWYDRAVWRLSDDEVRGALAAAFPRAQITTARTARHTHAIGRIAGRGSSQEPSMGNPSRT